ncbi:MAG: MSMEG_4193 family putative phosphomutase [Chloroflexales bacterium]|nr:MSMEG_4193 family putative phosphomutase [Chloroflexales bacterium]
MQLALQRAGCPDSPTGLWYHTGEAGDCKEQCVTLLLLIRHGTNDWVHGRLAGWTPGVHLNEDGKRQATALSARLGDLPISAVYTSPLERCVETAVATAQPRGLALRLVEQIGEVRYGEWEGAELKELYKHELWPGVQFYPSGTRFPNGETLGEAQMRMVQALDGLRARHPKEIVAVFSHADIIKLAIAYYVGMHMDLFQRLVINPCSLTAIAFERMGPRLLAFNDTGSLEHLRPKPEPPAEAQAPADGAEPAPQEPAADSPAAGNGAAAELPSRLGSQPAASSPEQEHV